MRNPLTTVLLAAFACLSLSQPLCCAPAPAASPSPAATTAPGNPFEKSPGRAEFPNASALILKDDIQATVQADGTHDLIEYDAIKLLDKAGVERFGHTARLYDANVETVEVSLARVWSPDGRMTVMPPGAISDTVPEALRRTALYAHLHQLDISFKDAVEGSVVEFRFVHHRRIPWTGKRFWEISYTQDFEPILDTRFSFDSPDRMQVDIATPGMPNLQPQVQRLNGRTLLQWHLENRPALAQEPAMPPLRQLATQIQVSNFKSWDDFATWAKTWWDTLLTADANIQSKTASLVSGQTTDEGRIRAIMAWIAKEKKSLKVDLSLEELAPAPAVGAFRAVDLLPLDRAVLLAAMLRAANIRAYPALVAASDYGDPHRGLPSLQQFNRVLVAVAAGNDWRWIDPSAQSPDQLGQGLNNRPALVLNGVGRFTTTDTTPPHANREEISGVARLDADGSMETRLSIREHGANSTMWRSMISSTSQKEQQQVFQLIVSNINPSAVLRDFYVPPSSDGPLQVTLGFEESRAGSRTGEANGFQFAIPLLPQRRLISYADLPVNRRQYPLMLGATAYEERRLKIVLPSGWSVRSLPRSVSRSNSVGSYQVDVHADGRTITYYSRLILRRSEVPVTEYAQYKDLMDLLAAAMTERVVVQTPPSRPGDR